MTDCSPVISCSVLVPLISGCHAHTRLQMQLYLATLQSEMVWPRVDGLQWQACVLSDRAAMCYAWERHAHKAAIPLAASVPLHPKIVQDGS